MTGFTERPTTAADGDAIQFSAAGDHVKGEFRCAECGYGVAVCRELPTCPMCGCQSWEAASWRPFGRALETSHSA
jgi:hypothetical protein